MAYQPSTISYHRQPCDTFFVESDSGVFAARAEARDVQKLARRQRQELMANELSRIAADEYLDDHIRHMTDMENLTLPDAASIDIQEEIQWFMRPYLLDFLIEAHSFFQLLPETLFLAVNLLDRYCSKRVVYKRHYQLVGCASLLIAAKYGDRKDRVPSIRELKSMCCSLYDEEMFTQMEWHVLNTLEWIIGHPTVDSFLQLTLAEDTSDDVEVEHMAWYISEVAMYHKEFISVKPRSMARCSLALARGILGRPEIYDATWDQNDSVTVLSLSQQLHTPSGVLSRKYAASHMSRVSTTLERFLVHQAALQRFSAPPTPPCEQPKPVTHDYRYDTPQKPHGNSIMAHGLYTPPITPEGEFFESNGSKAYAAYVHQRPTTPTPASHTAYSQQQSYQQQYPFY